MSRLYELGYSLIPLGGDDGKKPTMNFRDRRRFPLGSVVNRMLGGASRSYGIRLDGLLVVDVDTDTPEASAFVEQNYGPSPARTKTSRGYHLWYRFRGKKPLDIRLPGIAIDFKAGANQLVVGPQSERPDGVVYWPIAHLPSPPELPWFSERGSPTSATRAGDDRQRIPVGSRNDVLKRRAAYLARTVGTRAELLERLLAIRDDEFDEPVSFSDVRVAELANWAWGKRVAGKLTGDASSYVALVRATADALIAERKHLALSLWVFLKGRHGGNPEAAFAIDPRALRRAGYFRDGVAQLYAAIRTLQGHNCLVLSRPARGKRCHHEYKLGSGLLPKEEGDEERAYSYISIQNEDPRDGEAA